MEIIEDMHSRKSTIIVSHMPVAIWLAIFFEQTIDDTMLNRMVHTVHLFNVVGASLLKKRSL
ncbi:ATP-binding protein [Sphingobacterium suaedae]|uniref:ATP-binding protein n=1 Tax=Sphingobacterium suaedae TaxID=1686402 RepID=A0ABW5KKN2_9SPHI